MILNGILIVQLNLRCQVIMIRFILGVVTGWITDILLTVLMAVGILALAKATWGIREEVNYIFLLNAGLLATCAGAFVGAVIAKRYKLIAAIFIGILSSITAISINGSNLAAISKQHPPEWYIALAYIGIMPVALFGGWMAVVVHKRQLSGNI